MSLTNNWHKIPNNIILKTLQYYADFCIIKEVDKNVWGDLNLWVQVDLK